jgi:hypothetical protein
MSKKLELFNKLFGQGNKTVKSFVNTIVQENTDQIQNNNYRSSSPWYTLIEESDKLKTTGKYHKNDKFLCGFEFENFSVQKMIDAAFSKCFYILLDEETYNDGELRSRLIDYINNQHLFEKSVSEIVKTFKKLDSEMLDIY